MRCQYSYSLLFAVGVFVQAATSAPADSSTSSSSCPHPEFGHVFDYVIVGGGTAGGVLARRLTENPRVTVAVVEAGTWPEDVHGNWTQVPFYNGNFFNNNDSMMWPFNTTPQSGLLGASRPYFRPKAFGGCSDINSMAYGHSSYGAHEMFAGAVGDQSYLYEPMLEYYSRTMNFTPPDNSERFANATPMYDPKDTNTGGGLAVTYPAYAQAWSTWFARGMDAIGIKKVNAFINGNLFGHSFHMNTVNHTNGYRSSSEAAYLRPVVGRKNLFLFNYTTAQRIIFKGNTATGVQVGTHCTVMANKEVILSAGVFQSPQMLMVSGVGPKALLQSLNIPVVADRPGVGQNLKEHIVIFISHQVNIITGSALANPAYVAEAINEFNNHAKGILTSVGGDYMAMEKIPREYRVNFSSETNTLLSKLPADWPEVAYAILPNQIPIEYATPAIPYIDGAEYATAVLVLFAPQSVGNVSISSPDINTPPLINPALFTNQSDVDVMVAGFKRLRSALASEAMAPILIGPEVVPGSAVATDEQIINFMRQGIQPFQHAFASNKMGVATDPMAVVDSHGRVFGVTNLRIADASSFPFLPPGPAPQIQVYTMAEKIAALIKAGQ